MLNSNAFLAVLILIATACGCDATSAAISSSQGSAARSDGDFTDEDFARHIRGLQNRVPDGSFHIIEERPFVVIGNESEATVRRRGEQTVRWAVNHLKQLYFDDNPNRILDVWLFKDEESYRKYAKEVFGDEPTTPFGYYSRTHRALIMNIGTGGGTLVHEIVHPFMESNFPKVPAWFNEGLASLYEQSGERDGKIVGFTNWRLAGLQRNIERGTLPSFTELCSTTTNEFYGERSGSNYAQARYLCYYLQQRGLLVDFYKQFRDNVDDDPTGLQTLKSVLRTDDLDAFQKQWETFVAELVFER